MSAGSGEATLKLTTQADLAALREYVSALRSGAEAYDALAQSRQRFNETQNRSTTGGGGGGGRGGGGRGGGEDDDDIRLPRPGRDRGDRDDIILPEPELTPAQRFRAGAVNVARGVPSFLGNVASTAIGVGLGQSLLGFITSSVQKFFEVDRIVTHLNRKFRETGDGAAYMGGQFGYVVGQTAGMLDALGATRDHLDKREFTRLMGFSRDRGADPTQVMHTAGSLGLLLRRSLSNADLAAIAGGATRSGMGEGRLGEFMATLASLAEQQLAATGSASMEGVLRTQGLASDVFGRGDPRGQGARGESFIQGLHSTLTGSQGVKTFLMRAMGYGKPGGPDYWAMRERLHSGVFDPRNVVDLFEGMAAQGAGPGMMRVALEQASQGALSPQAIRALVDRMDTSGERADFLRDRTRDNIGAFYASLEGGEGGTFKAGGFAALGKSGGRIGSGEFQAVTIENAQIEMGATIAPLVTDLTKIGVELVGLINDVLKSGVLGDVRGVLGDIRDVIRDVRSWVGGGQSDIADGLAAVPGRMDVGVRGLFSLPSAAWRWGTSGSGPGAPTFFKTWADQTQHDMAPTAPPKGRGP